ncbi:hypothetical protein PGT21_025338 [Puccinia graminis f. sp. tritici]|uniref:F-box domain-containing protein n=1 Tax=Puccinia graminis f. sp. tritici TaxID=56615 RepID=A0A5B0N2P0_PUCGR|nr:hypothetical protein PGT21_025338 [Puccinia graminis f. sp. tritici]KAA1123955.1 hypothetical protein PGTUg99_011670 [Puccinia graminis f. sp. tritici]
MLDSSPPEILDRIFLHSDPIELASLARVARFAHERIYGQNNQQHLWQKLFLNHFDDPLSNPRIRSIFLQHPLTIKQNEQHVDWLKTLTTRITLRQILTTADDALIRDRLIKHYPDHRFHQLYDLLFLILDTAHSSSPSPLNPNPTSLNISFLENLLSNPPTQFRIIHFAGLNHQHNPIYAHRASLYDPLVAAAAKLHTIYGLTSLDIDRPRTRGIARESSYSIRNYKPNNFYGPFIPNPDPDPDVPDQPEPTCRVSWPHLEALSLVVGLHLYMLRRETQDILAAAKDEQEAADNDQIEAAANDEQEPPNILVNPDIQPQRHNIHPAPFAMPNLILRHRRAQLDPNQTNNDQEPPNIMANVDELPMDPAPLGIPYPILQHQGAEDELDHELENEPARRGPDRILAQIPWPILNSLRSARPFSQLMHPAYDHPPLPWPPTIPGSPTRPVDLNQYDWAGVGGQWLRVVTFLDYRLLYEFNFDQNPPGNLEQRDEARRVMTLDLKVVSIGDPPEDDHTHPVPLCLRTDLIDRPPIFFRGTLEFNVGAKSRLLVGRGVPLVRGCVSMTLDGEVRWSLVSTFNGVDRWSSEGIQVGGVRSKWGVIGAWTDINRGDAQAPVGPFYFFKTAY